MQIGLLSSLWDLYAVLTLHQLVAISVLDQPLQYDRTNARVHNALLHNSVAY